MTEYHVVRAKDVNLVQAAITYIVNACADRDIQAIRQIGIREDQIMRLKKFTAQDLLANSDLAGAPVEVRIDDAAFDAWLIAVENGKKTDELIMRCTATAAPLPMMQHFFHLSSRQYKKICDFVGVSPPTGRTPRANPEENLAIYNEIVDREGDITAGDILDIAERCAAEVRIVWKEIEPVLAHGIDGFSTT